MQASFSSLAQLLSADPQSKQYFLNLPDYVRDQIELHPQDLYSRASLENYVRQIWNQPPTNQLF